MSEEKKLQETADEKIVEMYWKRDPDAIQETDNKYGSLLWTVAYNILSDEQDCEECQNDTYFNVWNAIPSTRPSSFAAYVVQVVKRIALNRYKEKSRQKRIPSQLTISIEDLKKSISSGVTVEEEYDVKEVSRMISEYLWSLNERQQHLFIDRYYMLEPVEKTAAELQISVQTAYRELTKIKQGLKKYLERNGVYV
ncbi:MAG: sigma-70 family RNA polymerase sigma factor [Ruminococcaceae bacterium]|nr:sigma-70 family RNA polymerase sigma factor [Oscillospiraceae bacterium]